MSRKQFNLTRTSLITFIQDLDENTADIQAKYFNNTIRWHLGHVLVVTEKLLFMYPKNRSISLKNMRNYLVLERSQQIGLRHLQH
ncbi:hypothetical protein CV093_06550 [Oceanobacillus sp. 143]|nr:hypothetical protein CV093_06550 [Oceanobacillus sp. 143]